MEEGIATEMHTVTQIVTEADLAETEGVHHTHTHSALHTMVLLS